MNKLLKFVLIAGVVYAVYTAINFIKTAAFIDMFAIVFIVLTTILIINLNNKLRLEANG